MAEQVETKDRWKFRRMVVFASLGFMGAVIGYLAGFSDGDNAVQLALAQSVPLAITGIILTYVSGPIADDWLQLRKNA
jgi:hypothetical protein